MVILWWLAISIGEFLTGDLWSHWLLSGGFLPEVFGLEPYPWGTLVCQAYQLRLFLESNTDARQRKWTSIYQFITVDVTSFLFNFLFTWKLKLLTLHYNSSTSKESSNSRRSIDCYLHWNSDPDAQKTHNIYDDVFNFKLKSWSSTVLANQ